MIEVTLGEICNVIKGQTSIMKAIPGNYPLVVTAEDRLTNKDFQFDTKAVCIPLVSSTGHGHASINRIHYQEGKFALGSILAAAIPKDEKIIDSKYLYIYLYYLKDSVLVPLMKGGANVSLTIDKLKTAKIKIPTLEKQKEIISLISTLNLKIERANIYLKKNIELIKYLRESVLEDAVLGKLVVQNSNDDSVSDLLNEIRLNKEKLLKNANKQKLKQFPSITEEEIPEILPYNWVWVRFNDVVNIASNLVDPNSYPTLPHIAPNNIEKRTGKLKEFKLVKEEKLISSKHHFYPGQLLYSKIRPSLSKAILVDFEGVCSADMYPIDPLIEPKYLLYTILSQVFLKQVIKKENRIKMPKLNQNELSSILFPLPSRAEQKRIVAKIDNLIAMIDKLEEKIIDSQRNVNLLMPALLKEKFNYFS